MNKNNIKEIKYIGFYDFNDSNSDRVCNLAATSKMDYIVSAINSAGFSVNIISPSWMGNNSKITCEKQHEVRIDDKIKVTFCPSFKSNCKVASGFKIILSLAWLFFYLIFNTKKDEKVIAYHVQWISVPIRLAKFFKRFKLVLEVEEIYSDVMIVNSIFPKWEKKLLDTANSYLLSTDLLEKKLEIKETSIVIYGVYDVKEQLSEPICDGKIHLVYAGVIDSNKKGAFNALEASKFLPEKYKLHIIGFGETEKLRNRIKELNLTNACKVVYDGVLSNSEYTKYCQSCHIGLSTQSMEGNYLETSFPSKILSYLSMGLRVVSCHVECVSQSKIDDLVTYYYEDSPKAIAKAIESIDLEQYYDARERIRKLDLDFTMNIKRILGDKK